MNRGGEVRVCRRIQVVELACSTGVQEIQEARRLLLDRSNWRLLVDVDVPGGRKAEFLLPQSLDAASGGSCRGKLNGRDLHRVDNDVTSDQVEIAHVLCSIDISVDDLAAKQSLQHSFRLDLEGLLGGSHANSLPPVVCRRAQGDGGSGHWQRDDMPPDWL